MSASQADGAGFDAATAIEYTPDGGAGAQQAYLDRVANDAEKAVELAQQTIDHLTASLDDRKAEAKRARAEANQGQVN